MVLMLLDRFFRKGQLLAGKTAFGRDFVIVCNLYLKLTMHFNMLCCCL